MTNFITGYFTGMIVMALIAWWIHNKYYRAHQKEYRRLMGGIDGAMIALAKIGDSKAKIRRAFQILSDTYRGE